MRRKLLIALGLATLLAMYVAWPYFTVRPALLAEARKDVFAFTEVVPAEQLRIQHAPVGKVIAVGKTLRVRPVSDSHHNNFIGYGGSTYVNVNNRIFYRPGGHCGPEWWTTVDDLSKVTEAELIASLLGNGYQQVAGR